MNIENTPKGKELLAELTKVINEYTPREILSASMTLSIGVAVFHDMDKEVLKKAFGQSVDKIYEDFEAESANSTKH